MPETRSFRTTSRQDDNRHLGADDGVKQNNSSHRGQRNSGVLSPLLATWATGKPSNTQYGLRDANTTAIAVQLDVKPILQLHAALPS